MKQFIICVAMLSITVFKSMNAAPDENKMLEIGKQCKDETSATNDDVSALLQKKTPDTTSGKCMIACVLKKSEVFTPDGKYDENANNRMIDENFGDDPDKQTKMKAVSDACKDKVNAVEDNEAGCERAAEMHRCAVEMAETMGLTDDDE